MRPTLAVAVLSALASAAPLVKRSNYDPPPQGDIDILRYALTLEYLERAFYTQGLANYTQGDFASAGYDGTFYKNLQGVLADEKNHVDFLATALGDKAVGEARYQFPVSTAKDFVALASVLEGVGVSAYLGAAAAIADKAYLTVAGSILTVEARHSAYLRATLGASPAPKPYDTPLNFNSVFSLAAQFIVGFNSDNDTLPFKAFPPLATGATGPVSVGDQLIFPNAQKLAADAGLTDGCQTVYAVLFSGLDIYYVPATVSDNDYTISIVGGNTTVGQLAPAGQTYIVLSTADGTTAKVSDENVVSGVAIVEVTTSG